MKYPNYPVAAGSQCSALFPRQRVGRGGIGFQFVPLAIGQAKQSSGLRGRATGFARPLSALAGKNIIIRLQESTGGREGAFQLLEG